MPKEVLFESAEKRVKHLSMFLSSLEEDLSPFVECFREFCKVKEIDRSKMFDVEVSLEELIVNSFSHGNEGGPVNVRAEVLNGDLKVVLRDKGPLFDFVA